MKHFIPIEPMGAVRMTQRGKFVKPNAQRYLNYKQEIKYKLLGCKPLMGVLAIDITFYMPIPPSWSKKQQELHKGQHHYKKPDIDNLIKGLFDSLNKICWNDDNQVSQVTAKKVYSEFAGIEFEIVELMGIEGQAPKTKETRPTSKREKTPRTRRNISKRL